MENWVKNLIGKSEGLVIIRTNSAKRRDECVLSERFYGMGEPLIQREGDTGVMSA